MPMRVDQLLLLLLNLLNLHGFLLAILLGILLLSLLLHLCCQQLKCPGGVNICQSLITGYGSPDIRIIRTKVTEIMVTNFILSTLGQK